MSVSAPGSLTQQSYADVMAFLLQENGYPSGNKKLTFKEAMNSKVKLIYQGQ